MCQSTKKRLMMLGRGTFLFSCHYKGQVVYIAAEHFTNARYAAARHFTAPWFEVAVVDEAAAGRV